MKSIFEQTLRVAIRDILAQHATEGKFGFVLTKESYELLVDELYDFLNTSRELKTAGDRMIARSGLKIAEK
jgi:putative AlgH/UPF0301 family transcriptional regulator